MATRRGDTLIFPKPPVIAAHACIGGKKEGEGPLAACFDALSVDNFFGQSSWEAAEKELALQTARLCLKKAQTTPEKVSLVLAGDLQAQCTASSYAMRELGIPFAGLFGACSTMAEALGLGAQFAARFGDTELEPCDWYGEANELPNQAGGFYSRWRETLALLDVSILKCPRGCRSPAASAK